METDELITLILQNQAGVKTTDARLRARELRNVQVVVTFIRNYRNWHFRYKHDETTVDTTGQGDLPADWMTWGPSGGAFLKNTTGRPLQWVTPWMYTRLLENQRQIGNPPRMYTELGMGANSVRRMALYPTPNATVTLSLHYYAVGPTLTDDNDGLLAQSIPLAWHQLIYEAVCGLEMKDTANIQSREQRAYMKELLEIMVNEERGGKQEISRLAPFSASNRNRRLL